jgi:hypothetical protein
MSLAWDSKTNQFKKPAKGAVVQYLPLTGTWFEYGKPKTIAKEFDFSKSLQTVLKKAAAEAKKGSLSPEDKAMFDQIAGLFLSQPAEQTGTPAWQAAIDASSENF